MHMELSMVQSYIRVPAKRVTLAILAAFLAPAWLVSLESLLPEQAPLCAQIVLRARVVIALRPPVRLRVEPAMMQRANPVSFVGTGNINRKMAKDRVWTVLRDFDAQLEE
eukprot:COSAG01_NODE_23252_length_822_cov_1.069156_1_plen_110_part_00